MTTLDSNTALYTPFQRLSHDLSPAPHTHNNQYIYQYILPLRVSRVKVPGSAKQSSRESVLSLSRSRKNVVNTHTNVNQYILPLRLSTIKIPGSARCNSRERASIALIIAVHAVA